MLKHPGEISFQILLNFYETIKILSEQNEKIIETLIILKKEIDDLKNKN